MRHFLPRPYYQAILLTLLVISLGIAWKLNQQVLTNTAYIPVDDFSRYWAAGRLILVGDNPYDPQKMQMEHDAVMGRPSEFQVVPMMWTPPWVFPFVIPFGMMPYALSRLTWLMVNIGCILICSDYLWKLYHGEPGWKWLAWLAAFTFGPIISVLQKGQPIPIILLGITGFLYTIRQTEAQPTRRDFLAGLWASLITIKPQLYYLFWPALLFWVFKTRRWIVFGGVVAGVLAGTIFSMLFNPQIISQYIQAFLNNPPAAWATPTIGGYLRIMFGQEKFWLQFVSPIIGLAGICIYFIILARKNRNLLWDWLKNNNWLLFASVITAAYAWTYDLVVLLPPILMILALAVQSPQRKVLWGLLASLMLINILDLILHRWLDEFWFGWLAPAYLLWFYIGIKINRMGAGLQKKAS